jgi:hypothetical protein
MRNQYLGMTQEPVQHAKLKIILSLIILSLSAGVMISEEMHLIKHHYRITAVKVRSKAKRCRFTKSLFE